MATGFFTLHWSEDVCFAVPGRWVRVFLGSSVYLQQPPHCALPGARPPPHPGVRSPLPPRVPACGEPALLPPPCEPAMHGGSQSAVKVASLLGRGEGGRHQLPVTLGKSLPLVCPQPPCLQDGETRAERSGGAAWGAHFPAGFVRKCPHGVRGWGSVLLVGGCTRGCGPGSHLLLHPASVCFWCPAWLCC